MTHVRAIVKCFLTVNVSLHVSQRVPSFLVLFFSRSVLSRDLCVTVSCFALCVDAMCVDAMCVDHLIVVLFWEKMNS